MASLTLPANFTKINSLVKSCLPLALLLHISTGLVSQDVLEQERKTGQSIPRRGTVHDMGASVSHKGIICYKRFVEGKTTSIISQETCHTPLEVEYYVECFQRVKLCAEAGMALEEIAQATAHSKPLVKQYLRLIDELSASIPPKEPTDPVDMKSVPGDTNPCAR